MYDKYNTVSYFYDGTPVPELLTKEEAIKFLRLDDGTTEHPESTLQYYRTKGLLQATQVGKRLRYRKAELLKFLDAQTSNANRNVS